MSETTEIHRPACSKAKACGNLAQTSSHATATAPVKKQLIFPEGGLDFLAVLTS